MPPPALLRSKFLDVEGHHRWSPVAGLLSRTLRGDRSDTIVTEAFKYNECGILTEFFFRFSKVPPMMQGNDESVLDPSPIEKAVARKALQLCETDVLFKLSIPNADGVCFSVTSAPVATPYIWVCCDR